VGSVGGERQIQNVAAGSRDTDAVNMGQYKALASAAEGTSTGGGSGPITNVYNTYNSTVNNAPYFNANSTGADSKAVGKESVAVGGNAVATADRSIAIGENSSTTGASAVSLGYGAAATGSNSVAIVANTIASRSNEVAMGNRTVGQVANAVYNDQAVNLGQARQMAGDTLNQANNYTDIRNQQTLNQANAYTDAKFGEAKKLAQGGAAIGIAASNIVVRPDLYRSMGVAVGAAGGQAALAIGFNWRDKKDLNTTYSVKAAIAPGMAAIRAGINWAW
jgi:autotransporter adhesin